MSSSRTRATFTERTEGYLARSELDRQARRNPGLGRRPGQGVLTALGPPRPPPENQESPQKLRTDPVPAPLSIRETRESRGGTDMASVHLGAALGHIHRLFGEGTLAGLPDAQLLKRYVEPSRRAGFRGPGPAPRADGHVGLPGHSRRPQRRRRCLSGRVPPPGPQGRLDPGRRCPRRLAASRGVPHRLAGQVRRRATTRSGTAGSRIGRHGESVERAAGRSATRFSTRRSTGCPNATASRSCSATWKT